MNILKDNRKRSIFYMVMVAILWSTGGLLIKMIEWNSLAIVGSKSLVASLTILIYLRKPKMTMSKVQILGAVFYAANVILIVLANRLTTAANVVLLRFTSPVFVAVLGAWILKEKTYWYDWITMVFVFGGMGLFFIDSAASGNMLGNVFAVMAGFFLASLTITLKLQEGGSAMVSALLGNILAFVVTLPFMFQSMPNLKSIIAIILLGVVQLGISYILYSLAVEHLSVLEAILITVLEPILNPIWVFVVLGERPSVYAIIGGTIILLTVIARNIYVGEKLKKQEQGMQ